MMIKITEDNWQKFCSDNFLDETLSDLIYSLTKFKNVDIEINKHEGKNMLNISIQLIED